MVDRQTHLREAINWYYNFCSRLKSDKWRLIFTVLLPLFEKKLLQGNDYPVSFKKIFSSVVVSCIYHSKVDVNISGKTNTIYFWPFQFYHCDFMVPVINELIAQRKPVEVLVQRENLVPYLKNLGVEAELITFKRQLLSIKSIFSNFISLTGVIWQLFTEQRSMKQKIMVLETLTNTGMVNNTLAAVSRILPENNGQYHMVGYDLSILGRVIIHEANALNVANGRIQNGAPNYLLCGYSEVQEVFFWDEVSANAYQSLGYSGKSWITGNLILFKKLSEGSNQDWENWLKMASKECDISVFVALSGPGHNTSVKGHVQTLDLIRSLIEMCSQCLFLIKLHPKDDIQYYQQILSLKNVFITDDLPFRNKPDALDILIGSYALITGASTVALDALQLNRPVVSVDPMKELGQFEFLNEMEVLKIHEAKDLHRVSELFEKIGGRPSVYQPKVTNNPAPVIVRKILESCND